MEKPKIPDISQEQVQLFAKGLILAMLSTNADTMTITEEKFSKDGHVFGSFEVKIKKLTEE